MVKNTRPEVVKLVKIAKIAVFQDLNGIERNVIETSEILENEACSCSLNTCLSSFEGKVMETWLLGPRPLRLGAYRFGVSVRPSV